METFHFKRLMSAWITSVSLLFVCTNATADDLRSPRVAMLVDSFCFVKQYGSYMLHSTLPDGRLRLIAEARSRASGQPWALELLLTSEESRDIWLKAVAEGMSSDELEVLSKYCTSENSNLKNALNKDTYLKNKPAMDKAMQQAAPGFPIIPITPGMQLTSGEEVALATWRGDARTIAAAQKLSRDVLNVVRNRYLELGPRVRHIPFVWEEHQPEPLRQILNRSSNKTQ
ncbi:hypothetical protein LP417_27425 [Polaromonas sp. P1-6]|nr:hypothetical protein LP417_27425 [Polaromonas sp. P1-6]